MGVGSSGMKESKKKHRVNLRAIYRATGYIHDGVLMLWVRYKSFLYHRLSLNIVREVFDYIGDSPLLLACSGRKVFLFSVDSKQYRSYFKLRKAGSSTKLLNSTLMGEGKVFMVLSPVQFAAHIEGQIQYFGLRTDKEGCGIVYDRVRDCVYIFGGKVTYSWSPTVDMPGSEVFSPSTLQFTPMADMHRGRSDFSICWHFELVYLCGGRHNYIETFDPRGRLFREHSIIISFFPGLSTFDAVSNGEDLFILSPGTIWRERNRKWSNMRRSGYTQLAMFNNGNAAVRSGVAYFAGWEGIVGVNLMTGDETQIPYPVERGGAFHAEIG